MPSDAFKKAQASLAAKWTPEMETRILHNLRSNDVEDSITDIQMSGNESRFALKDKDLWMKHLEEEGYVVLSCLEPEAVKEAKRLIWEYLETKGMMKNDAATWMEKFPGDSSNGICSTDGAAHSEFAWYVRSHPSVHQAFIDIWGTDELITSFDAINVFRPYAKHNELKTRGGWLHLDQNSYPPGKGKSGKQCIQGLVTMLDANSNTGSLVVVPGSHLRHDEICGATKSVSGQFVALEHHHGTPLQDVIYNGRQKTMVCANAGDLILWDSRTVHANNPALDPKHDPDELLRVVCYTCMTPTSLASNTTLLDRQRAYEMNLAGTHWPHDVGHRGGKLSNRSRMRVFEDADELIKSLVGERVDLSKKPSAEATAAMAKANELELEGDISHAKEWIDKATALGHSCLAEHGGWK